jgi:acetylornithine/N-succinyldiaminopimelate aminotransferase
VSSHLMGTYKPAPVCFVAGEGAWLVDDRGRRYLDLLCGIAVTSLGHAHPGVADALCAQAQRLLHVSNLFQNELAEDVAARLDRLVGDGAEAGGKVFFANSGAEANECAIKLARKVGGRGRHTVVSAYGSFHGRTLATLHATGQPHKHEAFAPLPEGFVHVAYGDASALEVACDPSRVAAVLLEAIEGEGGVVEPPAGYLREARRICDERGILLVLDEVQTGLGRTGRWFAFQHEGVRPDVVTMAKALGNGVPVGACWARAEIAGEFAVGDHGSTFGGQPLALAAARATLQTMETMGAPHVSVTAGARFTAGLAGMPGVAAVRGRGLLIGVVLEEGIDASGVVADALESGLVINSPVPGVLRLAPPFVISESEIDHALGVLAEVLARAAQAPAGVRAPGVQAPA